MSKIIAASLTPCLPTFRAAFTITSTSLGRKYSLSRSDGNFGGGERVLDFAEKGS
ncbi:hypothetical protein QUB80_23555 [Chlorogloeopsis sp. ULAP01]|nr:hypothetical protein [Chlorogloeopsis sp. ULAP01]